MPRLSCSGAGECWWLCGAVPGLGLEAIQDLGCWVQMEGLACDVSSCGKGDGKHTGDAKGGSEATNTSDVLHVDV